MNLGILIAAAALMFAVIGGLSLLAHYYTLSGIKSRTVGDGQHGTARFASRQEIKSTYKHIPFRPGLWRRGEAVPRYRAGHHPRLPRKEKQHHGAGGHRDVHALMIGASA